MKICDGKKKVLTVADLKRGDVFRTNANVLAEKDRLYMVQWDGGAVVLTGTGPGDVYSEPTARRWEVTAVYPNACINPGEPE